MPSYSNIRVPKDVKCLSSSELQALFISPKKNKYNNVEVISDGKRHQSKKELREYQELVLRKASGDIFDFKTQVKFPLMETTKGNKRIYKSRFYAADFVIYDKQGDIVEIIDTKSPPTRTQLYTLKIHLLYLKYGIEVTEK
jgi:hypothetical protein